MEDENYRNMILSKLNKSMDRKVAPDDHIQDVVSDNEYLFTSNSLFFLQCLKKSVYKGMLKVLLTIVHGLEISISNYGVGGLSSAFHLLEISHTHFWTKVISEKTKVYVFQNIFRT